MRILFVCPFLPDVAAPHGGGVLLGNLAEALARKANLGAVALCAESDGPAPDRPGSPWQFVARIPHATRPDGLRRLPHLARMLNRWRRLPLVAAKHHSPQFTAALAAAVRSFRPDVAFVEMAHMAQYLPALAMLPTVLTDHEAGMPANTHAGLGRFGQRRDQRLWAAYVDRFYPMATSLQAVTAEDAKALERRCHRPCAARPPLVPVAAAPVAPGAAPPRALFLGDYAHGPNPEAARALAQRIWPKVRQRVPTGELWLAGANADRIADLAALPGVQVRGFAADLPKLFAEVRCLVAPVFSGSGIRIKCLSALAHGLPVVTNPLGARGCTAPASACRVGDDDQILAELTADLLASAAASTAAGTAAFAWARSTIDSEAVTDHQLALAAAAIRGFAARPN